MIYCNWIKRAFDILLSSMVLFFFLPILLGAIVLIRLSSQGGVFFFQERAGLNGRPFNIIKFRTMYLDPDRVPGQTYQSDPEVTPLGRVLRRLKIDELPQVINVLKGDMSLIGPRPCLMHTCSEMPNWAKKRFHVRPGITGFAQVNGNISITWQERWKYDVNYVENCSFLLDLKILIKTVLVVFFGEETFGKKL